MARRALNPRAGLRARRRGVGDRRGAGGAVVEPGAPDRRRRGGRAPRGKLPARTRPRQHRPRPADGPRPALGAAAALRALRADLQHPGPALADRVHARPGGQSLRHRLAPAELPLARGQLRRPDPAARRRPADDRRRLPRPRAADHDARLSPGADRGLDLDHGRGDRARAVAALEPGAIVDVYDWARNLAMRIAMRALARPRPRRRRQGRGGGASLRARARLLRHRLRPAPAARARGRRGGSCSARGRCSTRSSTARSPSGAGAPTTSAATSSAC